MKKEELLDSLAALGYPVVSRAKTDIAETLNELADSEDPRLVEGFPVVIANCAFKKQKVNIKELLSKHEEGSLRRENLEKLFYVSSKLIKEGNFKQPVDLLNISKSLKAKYGNLLSSNEIDLSEGVSLSTERLRNTFKRYTEDFKKTETNQGMARDRKKRSFRLNLYLSALFSPKQKEIVLKRYNGQPLTKTEGEYFSRTIKRKLEALADDELVKLARRVIKNLR